MAQKHLRELLQEDQEPFQLKHYMAERRCLIGRPCPKTDLQVKKRKPISRNPRFSSNLCESSCFFSGRSSPDPRKSPLFELLSPGIRQNRVFLQVPARTATILLEAAARIQKQSSKNTKSKTQKRENGFGLFGSVFKRLTNRNPTRGTETQISQAKLILQNAVGDGSPFSMRTKPVFSERGSNSALSSSSSQRGVSFEVYDGFGYGNAAAGDISGCDSSFRFALQTSHSSSSDQTPDFTSPATSPMRRSMEDEDSDVTKSLEKLREQEEEGDKEQCSPVSVLDPPNDQDEDRRDSEADLDLQSSFEIVQRAKRRLLKKLRRFERLAGLDAMEIERKLVEQEDDENNSEDDTSTLYDTEEELDQDFGGVGTKDETITRDNIEKKNECEGSEKGMQRRKWRMLKSWKGFEFECIDEIVESDFREEVEEWMRQREEVQEAASRVELAIFSFLVEEFSLELVSCA